MSPGEDVKDRLRKIKERAKDAVSKTPDVGPDVDLSKLRFEPGPEEGATGDLAERASSVGIDMSGKGRAGTYVQIDYSAMVDRMTSGNVEVMSISRAIDTYDWLTDYYWRAMDVDVDKFAALAELRGSGGYFIRARRGAKVELPVQACLYLRTPNLAQNVHNIVVVEEGAELHVITGCASPVTIEGLHVGVSELYVKRDASLTFTMIHGWSNEMDVRPRTGVVLEENASFKSVYVNLNPVKSLQSAPVVYLNGPNSKASLISIIAASDRSYFDVGNTAYLRGRGSRAEITSKVVAKDEARVISRGSIVGEGEGVKGHLDCRGIILNPAATILAIPQLEAKAKDLELSHEAAVGKIAEEEIYYLLARGFDEEEAVSTIIRGFMDVDVKDFPPALAAQVEKTLDIIAKSL
jgi:Fe-S cluster assembly scaffold protein SufB